MKAIVETEFISHLRRDVPSKIIVKFDIGSGKTISMLFKHIDNDTISGTIAAYEGENPQIMLFNSVSGGQLEITEEHAAKLIANHHNRKHGHCKKHG